MPTVQDVLDQRSRQVVSVAEGATVLEAAKLMNEQRIGAVVVTRSDKVIGIFTERDILCRVVATERTPRETRVEAVMSTPVAVCTPETTLDECRTVMRTKRLRHLPVVKDGALVGMISIGDLYEAAEQHQALTIHYLHEYIFNAR